MASILAVDLGGTKILFNLSNELGELITEVELPSARFASFDEALSVFLSELPALSLPIISACIAVAGPVMGNMATVTNLPWQLNADDLAKTFHISHVLFCNDFEAVGHGIAGLNEDDIYELQQGEPDTRFPRAIIGAGTGLGQAILFPDGDDWRVVPTEGGHSDFAPTTTTQMLLLEHLMERFGRVSYEDVLSGSGLVRIYEFLRAYKQHDEPVALRNAMIDGDPAAAVSEFGLKQLDTVASDALAMFMDIYAGQAGNLALSVLSRGGLYIAGGIAAKNKERFTTGNFATEFNAKIKMKSLLQTIPIRLITQPKVGLIGAQMLALKNSGIMRP
jgi:glucokinase